MGNEADNQPQPSKGDAAPAAQPAKGAAALSGNRRSSGADNAQRQYRLCTDCGERWDVTYLLPFRRYRCARCGATFRHDRARATATADAVGKARNPLLMILLLPVAIVGLEFGMAYAGGIDIERHLNTLLLIAGASAPASVIMLLWVRKNSRDAEGVKAVLLTTSAVGVLAELMFASEGIPDNRYQPFLMVIIVWLVLGGTQFSRFMTNQWRLPAVGPNGKV